LVLNIFLRVLSLFIRTKCPAHAGLEFSYGQGIYTDNTLHHWFHCNVCHSLSRLFLKNKVQDASLLSSSSSSSRCHGTASNLQFCSTKWEVLRLGSNYGLHETVKNVQTNSPTLTGRFNLRHSQAPHQNWSLSSIRSNI
jgi:hypothetical protein